MPKYECIICNQEFESNRKSALCPTCKVTPLVCVVCGKEFPRKYFPYNQNTCSSKCRGIYRKESGIAKASADKMKQTKLDRYGTLDPTSVTEQRNEGQLSERACPLCGKLFVPKAIRQVYCEDIHYGPCPVCGKLTEIKDYSVGPQACSEECRIARINATCLERYGNKDAVNSEHAKQLAREHSLAKYGVEYYSQTDEFKERYKQTNLERYGSEYPLQNDEVKQHSKETNLERYGVEYFSQTDEFKEKFKTTMNIKYGGQGLASSELREKITATNKDRYGVEFPLQSKYIQQKIQEASSAKYGVRSPGNSPEANAKREATNLERYGSANPWGSKKIQEKIKETWTKKYGGPNPMYDPEMAQITSERQQQAMFNKYGVSSTVQVPELKQKIIDTNMERYGVPWYWYKDEYKNGRISQHNKQFGDWLSRINIKYDFEFLIEDRSYDLVLPDLNILIELDPTVTHNAISTPWSSDHGRDQKYHLTKTKLAEKAGYRCIHIFDWDNSLCILSMLKLKKRIYARKCELRQIDQYNADIFTAKYHLQGKCKGQKLVYGLYYNNELIQIMSFGKPRYNNNYDFELLRLCTKFDIEIVGGPSKLFTQFKKDNPSSSVLSYCDYSKFNGSVYTQIGMRFKELTQPAKVWSKASQYITDNYLRKRGYDQIFNTHYGKGTPNEQLMLDNGWLPVYDCGQKVFEYKP